MANDSERQNGCDDKMPLPAACQLLAQRCHAFASEAAPRLYIAGMGASSALGMAVFYGWIRTARAPHAEGSACV